MIVAFFQSSGTWPDKNNLLRRRRRASLLVGDRWSSMALWIVSGPMALLVSRQRQEFSSFMLMGRFSGDGAMSSVALIISSSISGGAGISWCDGSRLKYPAKAAALSAGVVTLVPSSRVR